MNFKQLQTEQREWKLRNFPDSQSPFYPFAGIVEEVGEFIEAVHAKDYDKMKDSLGDAAVYLVDYASESGLDLEGMNMEGCNAFYPFVQINVILGWLGRATLKLHQNIRGNEDHKRKQNLALRLLVDWLAKQAKSMGFTLAECVEMAWGEVKHRDWVANPASGVAAGIGEPNRLT